MLFSCGGHEATVELFWIFPTHFFCRSVDWRQDSPRSWQIDIATRFQSEFTPPSHHGTHHVHVDFYLSKNCRFLAGWHLVDCVLGAGGGESIKKRGEKEEWKEITFLIISFIRFMALSFSQSESERKKSMESGGEKGGTEEKLGRSSQHKSAKGSTFFPFFVFISSSFSSEGEHKTHKNSISRRILILLIIVGRIFTTKFAFHSSVCELVLMPRNAFVIVMLFTYSTRKEFHFSLCMGQQKKYSKEKRHRPKTPTIDFPRNFPVRQTFFFRFLVRASLSVAHKKRKLTRNKPHILKLNEGFGFHPFYMLCSEQISFHHEFTLHWTSKLFCTTYKRSFCV